MSRTVLCGQTFVVSLLKPWPKGPCALQAKPQENKKKQHTQKTMITGSISQSYYPSFLIVRLSHSKDFL